MILHFDTPAVVPLLVDEPASERAGVLWDDATRVVSARLVYPEARTALAAARRDGRISAAGLRRAVEDLGQLVDQLDVAGDTAVLRACHELGFATAAT